MMNEPLSLIMTTDVLTVNPGDSLQKAKDILFSKRIHHLPNSHPCMLSVITSQNIILGATQDGCPWLSGQ